MICLSPDVFGKEKDYIYIRAYTQKGGTLKEKISIIIDILL